MKIKHLVFIPLLISLACEDQVKYNDLKVDQGVTMSLDKEINAITSKTILFGHASVGYNIIDGLEQINVSKEGMKKLRVIEIKEASEIEGPSIYHIVNGVNRFPKKKCDNFKELLFKDSLGSKLDIAFFKFCYVDFDAETNVNDIYNYYVSTIDEIRNAFPNLKIVHVTAPLTSHSFNFKKKIKNLLFKDIENIKRNEYNILLRTKYGDAGDIFDLANIESTLPNGDKYYFNSGGSKYYSLANIYTNDGGHLNKIGKLQTAKSLINLLGKISNQY